MKIKTHEKNEFIQLSGHSARETPKSPKCIKQERPRIKKHKTNQKSIKEKKQFCEKRAASRHGTSCEKKATFPRGISCEENASSHLGQDGLVGSRRGV